MNLGTSVFRFWSRLWPFKPKLPTPNHVMTQVVRSLIKGRVRLGDAYGTPIGRGGRTWCQQQIAISILSEDVPQPSPNAILNHLEAQKWIERPRHPPIARIYLDVDGRLKLRLRVQDDKHLPELRRVMILITKELKRPVDLIIVPTEHIDIPSWDPFAIPSGRDPSRTP